MLENDGVKLFCRKALKRSDNLDQTKQLKSKVRNKYLTFRFIFVYSSSSLNPLDPLH